MDINAAFPSKYIRACDLGNDDLVVTIEGVELEDITGDGEVKPVMHLEDHRPLVLNKTNGNKIAGMFGPDTDNWAGQQVVLHPTTTEFAGKEVACIRIKPVVPISPKAETVYQSALKFVTSAAAAPNSDADITRIRSRLNDLHKAKSLTDDELHELANMVEKLPVLPSTDINSDLPF